MGFRINTNVAALTAHNSAMVNNQALNQNLTRLSSGLRINKAADDASGLAIADSLNSQATGLGQAIKNANDGVNVAQTADGALQEYTNILNTVRTKAIQAASDGQNANSRKAIQNDINKLLQEAQNIAKTTSFNGQNLLDGSFTNKAFHIGAYAGETVGISIGNVQTSKVGDITSLSNDAMNSSSANNGQSIMTALATTNINETSSGYVLKAGQMTVNGVDLTPSLEKNNPFRLQDAKSVASAITDATGLVTDASTTTKGTASVVGNTTAFTSGTTLIINGQHIDFSGKKLAGSDADGTLTRAINAVSNQSGVTASVVGGKLQLTAKDGRNIVVTAGASGNSSTLLANIKITNSATSATGSAAVTTLASTATAAVTIAQGDLVINGHDMAGTYGDGTTIGSAATALQNAIRGISGFELSSISSGVITLKVDDGQDLNIAGSKANSTYNLTKGVTNSSDKGVINIYSTDKVAIGGSKTTIFGFDAGGYTPSLGTKSLDKVDVTSRNAAEVSIMIADSALKQIDTIRSDIGSTQNQLQSTVRNISVTQVNVTAARSTIMDVDFAAESANFAKHNILAQSGSYAMSQANAVQRNVLRLLQ